MITFFILFNVLHVFSSFPARRHLTRYFPFQHDAIPQHDLTQFSHSQLAQAAIAVATGLLLAGMLGLCANMLRVVRRQRSGAGSRSGARNCSGAVAGAIAMAGTAAAAVATDRRGVCGGNGTRGEHAWPERRCASSRARLRLARHGAGKGAVASAVAGAVD